MQLYLNHISLCHFVLVLNDELCTGAEAEC